MASLVRCRHCLLFKRFLIVPYPWKKKSIRKNWKKNSEGDKKVTRYYEGKKDPFVHAPA